MNLVQRTLKISIAATLAIFVAQTLNLQNPLSAGIIALLTVNDTRGASLNRGLSYVLAAIIGFIVASVLFTMIGFNYLWLGAFLLIFIPITYFLNLESTLSPISVLVTHFLIAGSVNWDWKMNGFYLIVIGVLAGFSVNFWMPSVKETIEREVEHVELRMRETLLLLGHRLTNENSNYRIIKKSLEALEQEIDILYETVKTDYENQLYKPDTYYIEYVLMRREQLNLLNLINHNLSHLHLSINQSNLLSNLFINIAANLNELNTGLALIEQIAELYHIYGADELPKTRIEFETRAVLYHILLTLDEFLSVKHDFYIQHIHSKNIPEK